MVFLSRVRIAIILIGFICNLNGCGGKKIEVPEAKIQGMVKMDGAPLKTGSIVFTSADSRTAGKVASATISDGHYELPISSGEKLVSVTSHPKVRRKVSPAPDSPEIEVPGDQLVSAKYNSESKLKINVKPGENTGNFDVESIKKAGR